MTLTKKLAKPSGFANFVKELNITRSDLEKKIILMKYRVEKYHGFLCDRKTDNSKEIRQVRSALNIQFAGFEKYIKEIGNNPAMSDGVNEGYYSVYQNAFSADIIQRVGPSVEAVLQDLDYILGKLHTMSDDDFENLFKKITPPSKPDKFDSAILESLSDFICGDDSTRYPIYRSSYYLTTFFKNISIDIEHDGSTRRTWVLKNLKILGYKSIESVILRLVDIREYKGNKNHLNLAIKTMNDILVMDGLGVKLNGVRPEIINVESIVLEQGAYIESAIMEISDIFPHELIEKLQDKFSTDLKDLAINFDRSGNGTAFFIRKILEKLIFIAFSKNGLSKRLEENGRQIGLEAMIRIASIEKINGMPILNPKTANCLAGIKFLGDTSAHNPVTTVSMTTVKPQLPFLVTAFEEIAKYI